MIKTIIFDLDGVLVAVIKYVKAKKYITKMVKQMQRNFFKCSVNIVYRMKNIYLHMMVY